MTHPQPTPSLCQSSQAMASLLHEFKIDPELRTTLTPAAPLPPYTTLLLGPLETPLFIPEPQLHTSPILSLMCCGPLSLPSETHTIRLPADSPALFLQLITYFLTGNLVVNLDSSVAPYNAIQITRSSGAVHLGPSTDATTRRSQLALRNLTELYALCLKYRFMGVLEAVMKRVAQYLDPTVVPEAFLWQLALIFENVDGEREVVEGYVQGALARLGREKAVGVVERITEGVAGNEDFARCVWGILVDAGYLVRGDGVDGG